MIRRIVQGRVGMASASSYDMAGNGIEQQLGMWRPPVSGIVKTFDAQLGGLYFLGFLWFCPQCRLLLAGYVPLYANGHPFESPARHLSIYSLSSPPPKHQASLIAAAHIIFFPPVFVSRQKPAAGGPIDRERLLPASASADASDHRHFLPVRPSLPWDHLPQVRAIGPLGYYVLFIYIRRLQRFQPSIVQIRPKCSVFVCARVCFCRCYFYLGGDLLP